MQIVRGKITLALIAILAVSACGSKNKNAELMNIRPTGNGPDEFSILPTKPLQTPDFQAALPTPTPGGGNVTDPTPEADAVAALGGDPARVAARADGSIGRGDVSLVSHSQRFGSDRAIRQALAAEDLKFRAGHKGRLLERVFNVNMYFKAYSKESLDKYLELERFRRLGVRTPSAPPNQADFD